MLRLRAGDRLVLASHNAGKLRELEAMMQPFGVAVLSAGALNLPEPDETEPDFAGNARLKAVAAASATGLPALADDSGFCVAALAGAPGVLSARWAGPTKDFAAAMVRVHAAGLVRFSPVPGMARPRDGDVPGPRRRAYLLATARRPRVWLRSDVHPDRQRAELWRNGSGREARD